MENGSNTVLYTDGVCPVYERTTASLTEIEPRPKVDKVHKESDEIPSFAKVLMAVTEK